MRKIISFMHISLDGFVAGPKGEMNWIKVDQQLFDHVGKRIGGGDTALYGRKTYEMMEGYWPNAGKEPNASKHDIEHSQWYNGVRKLVLSNTLKGASLENTEVLNDNLEARLKEIRSGSGPDILLFGSPTATHSLMDLDLIDGYWLFVNPVVLGEGIALFKNGLKQQNLELVSTERFDSGVVELNYVRK